MSPDAPELQVLRRGRWFAARPPRLQARMVGALRSFRAGEYVVRRGEAARGMQAPISSRTGHACAVGADREVLMHVGGPGRWTGEYPLCWPAARRSAA
jgi:hypothetical protein